MLVAEGAELLMIWAWSRSHSAPSLLPTVARRAGNQNKGNGNTVCGGDVNAAIEKFSQSDVAPGFKMNYTVRTCFADHSALNGHKPIKPWM